jgi:hypothetical protein|tara:strand:- start:1187 stop:1336 length:150 start_codon:yes stop_codon:yes gene_type:complete
MNEELMMARIEQLMEQVEELNETVSSLCGVTLSSLERVKEVEMELGIVN